MKSAFLARARSILVIAGTVTVLASAASAQGLFPAATPSIPDKQVNRDLVRRALLDTCVYGEAAKEGVKQEKVVDACQCASFKAMKGVKEEEVTKVAASKAIPDEWYKATTDAYGTCTR